MKAQPVSYRYLLAYRAAFELPALALRFFNVYGPLQAAGHAYAAVIPAFIDAATGAGIASGAFLVQGLEYLIDGYVGDDDYAALI